MGNGKGITRKLEGYIIWLKRSQQRLEGFQLDHLTCVRPSQKLIPFHHHFRVFTVQLNEAELYISS